MTDARSLTLALGGKWYRRYGLARCPAHGDRKPSLSLSNAPDGRLLARCHTGCTFTDILGALRDLGLIDGEGIPRLDPAEVARREAEDEQEAAKKERQALAAWDEAQPIAGTPAENYLRGRGITCPLPDSLRFTPRCWHPSAKRLPAMVARVDRASRFAVHRTYLTADGSGKAAIDPPKAMLGACRGGGVRVASGDGPLVVAEGIETALSLACGLLSGPAEIWACLSTSGMTGFALPPQPGKLVIANDGDDAGRQAAQALALRAHGLGWKVATAAAPNGLDWNDVLTGKGDAA